MSRYVRIFDRYRELVPDFPGFLERLSAPPPQHLRVNTLKGDPGFVAAALAAAGLAATAEPWYPLLLRVEGAADPPLGATLLHALGHFYLQSASSAVPALALGARPGERVLDLCAAPGSKATLIAQETGDRTCLVANEPNRRRAVSLQANLTRLGVTCALVTTYGGQNFPQRHRFHRVLVDAPCSGEGTWIGPDARPKPARPDFRAYLVRMQGALLRRGYEVLEPGGTLVYSTCTYAPEENEGVLGPFLAETGARVLPLDPALGGEPGLTAWQDERYPADLAEARRLYPHRFGSEGFFVARLAKP